MGMETETARLGQGTYFPRTTKYFGVFAECDKILSSEYAASNQNTQKEIFTFYNC
jgi:hypothetical protein